MISRFFTAIPSTHPGERRLYRLKVDQPYTDNAPVCISCGSEETKLNETVATTHHTSGGVGGVTIDGDGKKGSRKSGQHSSSHEKEQLQGKFSKEGVFQSGGAGGTAPTKHSKQAGGSSAGNPSSSGGTGGGTSGKGSAAAGQRNAMLAPRDKSCSFVSNLKFSTAKSYFVLECAGPDIPFVLACSSSEKEKVGPGEQRGFHHRNGAGDGMAGNTHNPLGTGGGSGSGYNSGGGGSESNLALDGINNQQASDPYGSTPYLNVLTVSKYL